MMVDGCAYDTFAYVTKLEYSLGVDLGSIKIQLAFSALLSLANSVASCQPESDPGVAHFVNLHFAQSGI